MKNYSLNTGHHRENVKKEVEKEQKRLQIGQVFLKIPDTKPLHSEVLL